MRVFSRQVRSAEPCSAEALPGKLQPSMARLYSGTPSHPARPSARTSDAGARALVVPSHARQRLSQQHISTAPPHPTHLQRRISTCRSGASREADTTEITRAGPQPDRASASRLTPLLQRSECASAQVALCRAMRGRGIIGRVSAEHGSALQCDHQHSPTAPYSRATPLLAPHTTAPRKKLKENANEKPTGTKKPR